MTDPSKFIDLVFSAEPILKRVMPLSTLYAFRTTGNIVRAHAMFIFSPLEGTDTPVSTAHYFLHDGTVLSIISLNARCVRDVVRSRGKDSNSIILMLDFYNPPCVYILREEISLTALLEEKLSRNFVNEIPSMFKSIIDRCTVFIDEVTPDIAYIIERSPLVDSTVLSSTAVLLCTVKLLLEGKISYERALKILHDMEKIIIKARET